jgi:hypothetical protein
VEAWMKIKGIVPTLGEPVDDFRALMGKTFARNEDIDCGPHQNLYMLVKTIYSKPYQYRMINLRNGELWAEQNPDMCEWYKVEAHIVMGD